jgi:rhamnopyranosyl-N-acetylglucosaminyl-diphospho-decaprenol beta-1,3/1,4-galactofuranosyltransferase
MSAPSVVAIVLTHNAPAALARCIEAITAQTSPPDAVLVVDNASAPPARLASDSVTLLRREINDGPAGGHACGLEWFARSTFDAAWVMDDDCIPAPECLERLRARAADAAGTVVFPLWVDEPTGEGRFLPAWCGFLLPRSVVERVGGPRSDFVWWAEDTEYLQWRMIDGGVPRAEVPDAVVVHRRVRTGASKPAWKFYYEARNTIVYRLFIQQRTWNHFRLLARSLVGLLAQVVVREDHKLTKLSAFSRGTFDGLRRRLGLRVPLG